MHAIFRLISLVLFVTHTRIQWPTLVKMKKKKHDSDTRLVFENTFNKRSS